MNVNVNANHKKWKKIEELLEIQNELLIKHFGYSNELDSLVDIKNELSEEIARKKSEEPIDSVTEEVVKLLASRSHKGVRTYAMTMDRDDLSMWEWMCHFREELADGLVYLTKMMRVQYEIEQRMEANDPE